MYHRENGPVIEFGDGYAIYALRNTRVPEFLVMTKAEGLDPHMVLKETNAEVRARMAEKIGNERILQELGYRTLDRQGDEYELVLLNVDDSRQRPYLRMLNPSIGIWHVEGVPPEIRTVKGALEWRNGTSGPPSTLT